MANPFSLEGKVALVTGANTGIGQGIAIALAAAGADIAAAWTSPATLTFTVLDASAIAQQRGIQPGHLGQIRTCH